MFYRHSKNESIPAVAPKSTSTVNLIPYPPTHPAAPIATSRSFDVAASVLKGLKRIGSSTIYLSKQDLVNLRVKCTALDFNTGQPQDGGEKFLDLLPLRRIDMIAKENRLDTYDGLTVPEHPGETNRHSANFLHSFFHSHLTLYDETIRLEKQHKRQTNPDLLERSGWRQRG